MAYDTELERRIDVAIRLWGLVTEKKKMFGGVGYMLNGNMAFGIHGDEIIVRTSEEIGNRLLKQPGVRHFEMGGMALKKGWYLAGGEAIADDHSLAELLSLGRDFALSLPPKR